MRVSCYLLLCMVLGSPLAVGAGKEYCALKVLVEDPKGKPTEALVWLADRSGKEIAATNAVGGIATMCDVPLKPFRVVVGDGCGQVTVWQSRVIHYPAELTIRVVYKSCSGLLPPGNSCFILFRVRDSEGTPIKDVVFREDKSGWLDHSDSYGRIHYAARFDNKLNAVLTHPGFVQQTVEIPCTRNTPYIEKIVTLDRATRPSGKE